MSILTLFQASRPDASLWTTVTIQFSLPYFSISIALNVLLTLLLVSRLFYMSVKARRTIGGEHGRTYISIAAMLLESAAPYAIVGLIFIITYARNSNVQNLVLPVLSQIMVRRPSFPLSDARLEADWSFAVHQPGSDHPAGRHRPRDEQHGAHTGSLHAVRQPQPKHDVVLPGVREARRLLLRVWVDDDWVAARLGDLQGRRLREELVAGRIVIYLFAGRPSVL